jgi:hypothetical protein
VIELGQLVQRTAEELRRSVEDVKQEIRGEQQATKKIKQTGIPRTPFETPGQALTTPLPEGEVEAAPQTLTRVAPLPKQNSALVERLAKTVGLIGQESNLKVKDIPFTQQSAVEFAQALRDDDDKLLEKMTKAQMAALLKPFGVPQTGDRMDLYRRIITNVLEEQEQGRGIYVTERRAQGLYGTGRGRGLYGTTMYRGNGQLRLGVAKPVHLFGRGIAPSPPPIKRENNYRQFGKYLVNMKYLHEGILNLYHETMKRVKAIPPRLISKDFQSIIYRILEKGELPRSLFYKLSDAEQTFLREVLKRAWLAEKLGMGDQGRKKGMFEDETDADMRRFNLLKGIVIAGNNDKKVVNELMSYLHKFVEERRIEPKMGNDILRNLAIAV